MIWATLLSIASHHNEPADPNLIQWIKDRLDQVLGLGPWTVVAIIGLFIFLMPVVFMAFYWRQQRRQKRSEAAANQVSTPMGEI